MIILNNFIIYSNFLSQIKFKQARIVSLYIPLIDMMIENLTRLSVTSMSSKQSMVTYPSTCSQKYTDPLFSSALAVDFIVKSKMKSNSASKMSDCDSISAKISDANVLVKIAGISKFSIEILHDLVFFK